MPVGILADTAVIVQAPFRLLASGCADVISNVTAVLDWKLATRLRNEEYLEHGRDARRVRGPGDRRPRLAHQTEPRGVGLDRDPPMIVAGIAMSVAGSSRPCSGSEHLFSHALDRDGRPARACTASSAASARS